MFNVVKVSKKTRRNGKGHNFHGHSLFWSLKQQDPTRSTKNVTFATGNPVKSCEIPTAIFGPPTLDANPPAIAWGWTDNANMDSLFGPYLGPYLSCLNRLLQANSYDRFLQKGMTIQQMRRCCIVFHLSNSVPFFPILSINFSFAWSAPQIVSILEWLCAPGRTWQADFIMAPLHVAWNSLWCRSLWDGQCSPCCPGRPEQDTASSIAQKQNPPYLNILSTISWDIMSII